MSLKETYDFDALVNEAERLVLAELEDQLGRTPGLCRCQECVLDMAACALNHVRPSYRVSLLGNVAAADESIYRKEVSAAVAEAVQKIKANPSHD